MMKQNVSFLWLSCLLVITILLAACGNTQETPTVEAIEPTEAEAIEPTEAVVEDQPTEQVSSDMVMLPEVDPSTVQGDVLTAGSSTVFPLTEAVAVLFKDEGYTGNITIDSIGTGAGFERFCIAGESDISNASRAIKDEEIANCAAINRTPIEFRVGTDALAIVVSQQNDFVTDVSIEELAKIFSSEATLWSDIRADWPAEEILRFSPGTDSGTYDFFLEFVMDEVYVTDDASEGKGEEQILSAANIQFSEDDNVLVQGVAGSPYAIGYFGYAYLAENLDIIKAASVNGILPTEETAESGDYPLSRPLFIYSDAGVLASKPQVAEFISFYLARVNDVILDAGYFPASSESLENSKQSLCDATELCK